MWWKKSEVNIFEANSAIIHEIDLSVYFPIFNDKRNKEKIKTMFNVADVAPFLASKADTGGNLRREALQDHGNRLNVTVQDKVIILDLDDLETIFISSKKKNNDWWRLKGTDKASDRGQQHQHNLAGEMLSTESLMDPQKFVTTEYKCGTIIEFNDEYFMRYFRV